MSGRGPAEIARHRERETRQTPHNVLIMFRDEQERGRTSMSAMLEALKTLAAEVEPERETEAVDQMIADCGGDARMAAMSLLKISRTLAFELHLMTELRSDGRLGCVSH
jgi:hypothetical protein